MYFKEGDHILEIYWEMSGVPAYDVLISLPEIQKWTCPVGEQIPPQKKNDIIGGLRNCLSAMKIRPDF